MYKLDSTELYKRRVISLIDKGWTIKELSENISESYQMVKVVFFGSKKSLRIEQKISNAFSQEHDYLFETAVKRRKVS